MENDQEASTMKTSSHILVGDVQASKGGEQSIVLASCNVCELQQ